MSRATSRFCSVLTATAVAASVVGTSSAFQATVTMSADGVAGSTARAAQAATAAGVGGAAHDVAAKVAIDG